MDFIMGIGILDIIFAAIILYCAVRGAKTGFVRTMSGFLKFIVAFAAAKIFSGALARYLTVNSGIYQNINKSINNAVSSLAVEEATVEMWLEKMNIDFLPEELMLYAEDLIMKSHNSLQGFAEYFSENLSSVIFNAVCFITVFIAALIIWAVAVYIVDKIAGLPVLRQVNGLGGFAAGLIKGLFLCVLTSTLCYVIAMMDLPVLTDLLNSSVFARYLYIGSLISL